MKWKVWCRSKRGTKHLRARGNLCGSLRAVCGVEYAQEGALFEGSVSTPTIDVCASCWADREARGVREEAPAKDSDDSEST